MTDDRTDEANERRWSGRLAAVLIVAFIVVVLALMYLAVRGPR